MKPIKWEIGPYGDCISDGNYVIAERPHGNSTDWNKNSLLMIAAPELLEACKQAASLITDGYTTRLANTPYQGLTNLLIDAIAKAEGK